MDNSLGHDLKAYFPNVADAKAAYEELQNNNVHVHLHDFEHPTFMDHIKSWWAKPKGVDISASDSSVYNDFDESQYTTGAIITCDTETPQMALDIIKKYNGHLTPSAYKDTLSTIGGSNSTVETEQDDIPNKSTV